MAWEGRMAWDSVCHRTAATIFIGQIHPILVPPKLSQEQDYVKYLSHFLKQQNSHKRKTQPPNNTKHNSLRGA